MAGIVDLAQLLSGMQPELGQGEFVFCPVSGVPSDYLELDPLATFREDEGLTLLLHKATAEAAGLSFDGVYRQITLKVHSSLEAVGLTAAVSSQLADRGISANIIAASYHDHLFVPVDKAERALTALRELAAR